MQPARDWLIILGVSLAAVVASVAWNVFFFTNALNDQVAPTDDAHVSESAASALPALEEAFSERAAAALRYQDASFVDPSL